MNKLIKQREKKLRANQRSIEVRYEQWQLKQKKVLEEFNVLNVRVAPSGEVRGKSKVLEACGQRLCTCARSVWLRRAISKAHSVLQEAKSGALLRWPHSDTNGRTLSLRLKRAVGINWLFWPFNGLLCMFVMRQVHFAARQHRWCTAFVDF